MPESTLIGEAETAIGISTDTVQRWDRAGQVRSYRTKVPKTETHAATHVRHMSRLIT